MSKRPYTIELSDEDRNCLQKIIRCRTEQSQTVDRARILLQKEKGRTDRDIAEGLGICINTVRLCTGKYKEGGVKAALSDAQRPGHPAEITDDAAAWMTSAACQRPAELGCAQELWTPGSLCRHIRAHAAEEGFPRLETVSGVRIGQILRKSDFIEFLKILDKKYPPQDTIRVILDNHPAHKSKETRSFLSTMPDGRFEFVFMPKHGSWLNMIESFFSKMPKQMLKGIRVKSKEELVERIYKYFDEINAEPVIYHWKYKMDEISQDDLIGL